MLEGDYTEAAEPATEAPDRLWSDRQGDPGVLPCTGTVVAAKRPLPGGTMDALGPIVARLPWGDSGSQG